MASSRNCAGDNADDDDRIAWSAFLRMFTPVTTQHLHRLVASVVHRKRRCPEWQHSPLLGPLLCAQCADLVDAHLAAQFSRWRKALASSTPSRITEMARLVEYFRSPQARVVDAADAALELLRFARDSTVDAPRWVRWAFFQLVHRPSHQAFVDLRRWADVRRGGSARAERDLLTAKWAIKLMPDEATRVAVAEHVGRLRDGVPDPWQSLAAGARALVRMALETLRRERVEFYNANVAGPLLRRGMATDAGRDLAAARPLWTAPDDDVRPEVDDEERCRVRLQVLLGGPPRSARRVRQVLTGICDVAFGRRTVDLHRSAERLLRLPPSSAAAALVELGSLTIAAGLDWTDDQLAATAD